ncbi:Uncharacterised protein [Mammaliicoccus fleurettii]|nr:Uncharacterised protein [Mammaliicoccus fleurettii]
MNVSVKDTMGEKFFTMMSAIAELDSAKEIKRDWN